MRAATLSWQPFAACLDADPGLFFGDDGEEPDARESRVARARAVCAGCPVRMPCLEFATATQALFGVWAGEDVERYRPAPAEGAPVMCSAGRHWMTPENSKPVAGTARVRCRECLNISDRRTAAARRARARDRAAAVRAEVAS